MQEENNQQNGQPLVQPTETAQPVQPTQPTEPATYVPQQPPAKSFNGDPNPPKRPKRPYIILAIIALLVIGILGYVMVLNKPSEKDNNTPVAQKAEEAKELDADVKIEEISSKLDTLQHKARTLDSAKDIPDNATATLSQKAIPYMEDGKLSGQQFMMPADLIYSYAYHDEQYGTGKDFNIVERADAVKLLTDAGLSLQAESTDSDDDYNAIYSDDNVSCTFDDAKNETGFTWSFLIECVKASRLEEYRKYGTDSVATIMKRFPNAEIADNQYLSITKSEDGTVVGAKVYMLGALDSTEPDIEHPTSGAIPIYAVKIGDEDWKYIEKDADCASSDKSIYKGVFTFRTGINYEIVEDYDVCSTEPLGI